MATFHRVIQRERPRRYRPPAVEPNGSRGGPSTPAPAITAAATVQEPAALSFEPAAEPVPIEMLLEKPVTEPLASDQPVAEAGEERPAVPEEE
jgi:hypothetical protein